MKRYFPLTFALLAIVVAVTTVGGILSAYAGADSQTIDRRIKDLRKEYEDSKREMEEREKRIRLKEKEGRDVLKKIKTSEEDITRLRSTLIRIKNREKRLGKEISVSRERYVRTGSELQARSEDYARRLRSMYKRQRLSPLQMFFASRSVSSMMRGMKMFGVLAREDIAVMNEIRSHLEKLDTSLNKLTAAIRAQRSLASAKKKEETSLERTRRQRHKLLEEIKRDEKLERELYIQRKKDKEKAEAAIEKLLKERRKVFSGRRFLDDVSDDVKNYNFASRKGRLPWPVEGKVTSAFGYVTDPKTKTKTRNRGIEIATKHGEPVCAIGSGIVMVTQSIRGYGNFVMIFHPPEYVTIYAHLSDILVNIDTEVREGDIIGLAGSTGLIDESEASLLIEVLNGKSPENPLIWLTKSFRKAGS
ncbi:MAG: peptidoglycan DD-metalloendopeptidase family protein [Candidatus Latescibacteria bacterium]|nr:peptidoglycan DD-metalloendopeptidase family protein [Candidatus Latescibacterota bacterium]